MRRCLHAAEQRSCSDGAAYLRANAAVLELRLQALSRWAAGGPAAGPRLEGISAFALADAMDRLNAAARRREAAANAGRP